MHTSIKNNWLNLEKGIPLLIAALAIYITPWDNNSVFAMLTLRASISIILIVCVCSLFKVSNRSIAIILVLIGIAEIYQYNKLLYSHSQLTLKNIKSTELTHVRDSKYSSQRIGPYKSEYFTGQRALYAITGDYLQTDYGPSMRQDIVSKSMQTLFQARSKGVTVEDVPYPIFDYDFYQVQNTFGYPKYDLILQKTLGFNTPKIRLTNNVSIAKSDKEALELTRNTNIFAKPVITITSGKHFLKNFKKPIVPLYTVTNTYFSSNKHKFLVNNFNDIPLWLIYADANNPNWHAYIDSSPTEIYPANLGLKAVQVPPGSHEVYFEFSKANTIHKMFFIMQIIVGFMLACLILSYPFTAKYFKPRDIN